MTEQPRDEETGQFVSQEDADAAEESDDETEEPGSAEDEEEEAEE